MRDPIARVNFCVTLLRPSHYLPILLFFCNNPLSTCICHSAMSKKRPREFSTSPKFQRVKWAEKRTRQGTVLSAQVIATPGSTQTPTRPKKHTTLRQPKFTQDQTPRSAEAINDATSLPPIPIPDLLAPKRDRRGKV